MKDIPPVQLGRAIKYFLQGRLHFDKDVIGQILSEDDDYEVFRKIVLDAPEQEIRNPEAILRVTFNFRGLSSSTNKKLSLLPIPFIVAQKGFRSKTWMIGRKTGRFQGLYEWDTAEDAREYWNSFPMKMMKRRAVSSSLQHKIHATGA
jgi:hypothetical protein